jgi:hypothetical protein
MTDKLLAILVAGIKPTITCLIAGGLKCLYDYQADHVWEPALIDGAITALALAWSMAGVAGVAVGARNAVAALRQVKQ